PPSRDSEKSENQTVIFPKALVHPLDRLGTRDPAVSPADPGINPAVSWEKPRKTQGPELPILAG
ncbi:MAG TPA: hypothetical protein PKK30_18035, partial [Nitrospira sp.]|nr:hypothetical protein [Nitrospira sp.]